jgi:hypothetical protein
MAKYVVHASRGSLVYMHTLELQPDSINCLLLGDKLDVTRTVDETRLAHVGVTWMLSRGLEATQASCTLEQTDRVH